MGYQNDCELRYKLKVGKLPEELQLLFAPDGTLYVDNKDHNLYTLTPSQNALTIEPNQLQTDTVYSAETITMAGKVVISNGMHIILKAEKAITFKPDFAVKDNLEVAW